MPTLSTSVSHEPTYSRSTTVREIGTVALRVDDVRAKRGRRFAGIGDNVPMSTIKRGFVILALLMGTALVAGCRDRKQPPQEVAPHEKQPASGKAPRRPGAVFRDDRGHLLVLDPYALVRNPYAWDRAQAYWGTADRLQELQIDGSFPRHKNGQLIGASFCFLDSRIDDDEKRQIRWQAPDRIEVICGLRKSIYRVQSKDDSRKILAAAKWINIQFRRPGHLLRIESTPTYVYLDHPRRGRGVERVFMGTAGNLRQLTVLKRYSFDDGGSLRYVTSAGALWFPSFPDGVARQPTFKPLLQEKKRLQAVSAKKGRALRTIIGAKLYADLIPPRPVSPCDPLFGNVVAKVQPPKSGVTLTPDNAPRLSLHQLGGKPFKELTKHKLASPRGTTFEQLSDPVWFRRQTPNRAVSFVRWQVDKGFVPQRIPPPASRLRITRTKQGIEIARGGGTVRVDLPAYANVPFEARLINGGRSLVLLQPGSHVVSTAQTSPILLFVEKLDQPRPVRLRVPQGRRSELVTTPKAKVFYLATGPVPGPDKLYRVDPFRGRHSVVTGTRKLRCDRPCQLLLPEQLIIEVPHPYDRVVLFDLKRNRERHLRLPEELSSLLVIRREGKPTLIAVGDQLIDPVRARIVGKIPRYQSACVTSFDAKRELLYYAVSAGLDCTTIQAFDVAKKKLIGSVELKRLVHSAHPQQGPPPAVEHLFLLPDGTVLAIRP